MSVSNIDTSQAVANAQSLNQNEPTLKEEDGVLFVKTGRTEHPLQTEHCKPCFTVFEDLQTKAAEGGIESQDLLKRAQAQMEQLQSNQISTLSDKSKSPVAYAVPVTKEATSVSLTSSARTRAANVARLRPELSMATAAPTKAPVMTNPEPEERAEPSGSEIAKGAANSATTIEGSTSSGRSSQPSEHNASDGHGHGNERKSGGADQSKKPHGDAQLSDAELDEVRELQQRDVEVRTHEQAHKSAAGSHGGAISLSFRQGPDGKRYAVEGEVPVDLSSVSDDPEATVAKMQQIQRAALAPAEPSSADRRVAAKAASKAAKARKEIAEASMEADNPLKKEHGVQEGGAVKVDGAAAAKSSDTVNANALNQTSVDQPERTVADFGRVPTSPLRPDTAPQMNEPSADSVRPTQTARDANAQDRASNSSNTPTGEMQERATLSRPLPVNAYAKAASLSYAKADQATQATLTMNIYG